MNIKAVWKNEKQFGCEYLTLLSDGDSIIGKGTIIVEVEEPSNAHIVEYKILMDTHWATRKLSIVMDETHSLGLISDGEGNWFDEKGTSINQLKGAIDIDISATPFSNSLPINRMNWNINQQEQFHMVYISVPTLEVKKVPQTYQYVDRKGPLRYFKYRCYEYETTIGVDENGLVVSYPEIFSRKF